MRRWTLPSRAEQGRVILSGAWTTSICYKPREIERDFFFAAFGHDDVGQIGTETTINAGDMAGILMSAVQALEKRTAELQEKEAQMVMQVQELAALKAQNARLQAAMVQQEERDAALAARLERLEAVAAREATLANR